MAITPAQVDALSEFTNAQMVKLLRNAIAQLAAAGPQGSVTMNGRAYTLADMDKLRLSLREFSALAADDADAAAVGSAGCPVVTRQEAQI